jgi:predicted nuclease of predicted toxin-antitoxin system
MHVGDVGLLGASDMAIWHHAREADLVVVSKDEDFQRLSILCGPPPKVIWLRVGNASTLDIIRLLRENRDVVAAFVRHDDAGFLALGGQQT